MKPTFNEKSTDVLVRRAIVSLNNAGVSLLRSSCIRQAIETFAEALTVAHHACRTKQIGNDTFASPTLLFTEHSSVDINIILEKAYQRLSQPKPSTMGNMDLEVISDDESPAWIHARCFENTTESCMKTREGNFVIQTGHLGFEVDSEEEMAIECSIICYNYGIAYLCIANLPISRTFADKLYMGALKMFQLAFATLTSHHLTKEKLQSHEMYRVLITGLCVLRNLILLCTTMGMTKEKEEYLQYLGHLKQSIDEFCDFRRAISRPAHAA